MGSGLSDVELLSFHEGKDYELYKHLGANRLENDADITGFGVWAPNARSVSVVGGFNGWDPKRHPMTLRGNMGVWEAFVPGLRQGELYKYHVVQADGSAVYKADPLALHSELRPKTASVIWDIGGFEWHDEEYFRRRGQTKRKPVSIYEVHAGSWKRASYHNLADELVPYVSGLGYTHIQFMPLCEHVLDASWGYQSTGFFSATSRFGEPSGLMYLIDKCHLAGIGVIMDWVSAYLPYDEHGLRLFDGTALYEPENYSEPNQFGTTPFDFDKPEVRSFLLSNAMFWLREYHLDGLHLSNVSAMLYPAHGSREETLFEDDGRSHGATIFFSDLYKAVNTEVPGAMLTGAEFSCLSGITKPPLNDGLGLSYKWDGGFAKDMLEYLRLDPDYRKWHHKKLSASMMTAFHDHRILPLSHAEMVHGRRSLLDQMPGGYDQKFDQLRLLYAYMFAYPGKKLMFMGGEFAQFTEWHYDKPLDWMLLDFQKHAEMKLFISELNGFYKNSPAFYAKDDTWSGFRWLNVNDEIHSIIAFARQAERTDGADELVACVFNFNPHAYDAYRLGVSDEGIYEVAFNSAYRKFGGAQEEKPVRYVAQPVGWNDKRFSIVLRMPAYGALYLYRISLLEDEALAE